MFNPLRRGDEDNRDMDREAEAEQLSLLVQRTIGATVRQINEQLQHAIDGFNATDNQYAQLQQQLSEILQASSAAEKNLFEFAKYFEETARLQKAAAETTGARIGECEKTLSSLAQTLQSHSSSVANVERQIEQMPQPLLEFLGALEQKLQRLETRLGEPLARIDDWKRTLPPDHENERAAWLSELCGDIKQMWADDLRGNARLLLQRLEEHLRGLQEWAVVIDEQPTNHFVSEAVVDELDHTLFHPRFGVEWADVDDWGSDGERDCSPRVRARLRMLETALLNYRRLLQARLKERHDLAPVRVVPGESRFDPTQHETTEYFTTTT